MFCGIDIARNCYIVQIPKLGLVRAHTVHFSDQVGEHTAVQAILKSEGINAEDAEMAHMRMNDYGQPIEFDWIGGQAAPVSDAITPVYAYGGVNEHSGVFDDPTGEQVTQDELDQLHNHKAASDIYHLPGWQAQHKELDGEGWRDRVSRNNTVDRLPIQFDYRKGRAVAEVVSNLNTELSEVDDGKYMELSSIQQVNDMVSPRQQEAGTSWDDVQWLQQVQSVTELQGVEAAAALIAERSMMDTFNHGKVNS
jgi:hypothetical protein